MDENRGLLGRRTLLTKLGAGAIGATVLPQMNLPWVEAGMGVLPVPRLEQLTCQRFAPLVGTRFRVMSKDEGARVAAAPVELELTEVRELPTHGPWPKSERMPFAALFKGPIGILTQETYRVTHPELGTLEIFLVPVCAKCHGVYEAIFA